MKRCIHFLTGFFCLSLALMLTGCMTNNPYTGQREQTKTSLGSEIGAVTGAAIGLIAGKGAEGAMIGAGIGALVGGTAGHYMDKQENELRAQLQGTGVSVTRRGDNLILNMPGDITFASNSADIQAGFDNILHSVALVLEKYNKTSIHITGYTDSTGSFQHNFNLSEQRAAAVGSFLEAQGIHAARIYSQGMGPEHPIASNDTAEGRAANRRVELMLVPLT